MPTRKSGNTNGNADKAAKNAIMSIVWEDLSRASRPVAVFRKDDEFWFAAKDVCDILEIQNPTQFIETLPKHQKYIVNPGVDADALARKRAFISEAGLYLAVFKSDALNARPFQTWVTNEVLPEIRRTGEYKGNGSSKVKQERLNLHDILALMVAEREDGLYIIANVDGKYKVHDWDKHTFLTTHQRTVFDMLVLFFTRAFVNYSEKGLLKYVPPDAAELGEVRDLDWIIASCILPFLREITSNAILPAREQGRQAEAGANGEKIGNPGEEPSMVRLKRLGFISDNGKGSYIVNKQRLAEYAAEMQVDIPELVE